MAQAGGRPGRSRRGPGRDLHRQGGRGGPSPTAGTVVKVLAGEGDTVEVGQLLCEIASTNGAGPRRGAAARGGRGRAGSRTGGEIVDIVTPTGGESVTEGTILEWSVKVGDAVNDGDTVVEISTDKVDMELPAPASGTITEILFDEGDTVTVGQVIARMQVGAGAATARRRAARRSAAAAPATGPRRRRPPPEGTKSLPSPRRVAAAEGVDLATVTGTRPGRAHHQGRRAQRRHGARGPAPPAPRTRHQGRRGDARPLHGREPLDPDRDLVPHDHRHDDGRRAARSSRTPARRSASPT